MRTYLVSFVVAFAVAAVLTPVVRALAPYIGGVDRAQSSRKVHTQPIPRLGGIGIVLGFFAPLLGLFIYENDVAALFLRDRTKVVALFVGGLVIALLGLYDDLKGANAKQKFVVQFGIAGLMYAFGYRIDSIANPFAGQPLALGLLALPLTVLWIVGIINALNLIDGLDGLAGGVAAIAVGLTFAMAFNRPDVLMSLFMAALGGAILGFLLYNFNPATIFMGDTGSMFLGFVLSVTTVQSSQKSSTAVALLVPIVALGLPIADTLLAMVRRALRGRPLFSADREHIHHKLLALGLSHRQAVLALYGVGLAFSSAAFAIAYASAGAAVLLLVGLGVAVTVGLRVLGYLKLDPVSTEATSRMRERNLRLRAAVREAGQRLREADGVESMWQAIRPLGPELNASSMQLSLVLRVRDGESVREVLRWERTDRPATPIQCRVRLDLEARDATAEPVGELLVEWGAERREVDRDDEIALESLVEHLETSIERIRREPAPPSHDGVGGKVIELPRRGDRRGS